MLGAPVYGRLAGYLALDPSPAVAVLGERTGWDAGLRLFGAVHFLVLTGAAPHALDGAPEPFLEALSTHAAALTAFIATQGVQTNETQRCVGLLPCFLTIASETGLPLELLELGPSAGLNLLVDRYRYRYREGSFGPSDALLSFEADERGRAVPSRLLGLKSASDTVSLAPLVVRRRRGIDLAPVDVTTAEGRTLLRAFLWPGRADRVARLEAALATFSREPVKPELLEGDYVKLLPGLLSDRPDDAVTVVFQTASTGYLSDTERHSLAMRLEEAGADGRPLALVSTRTPAEREFDFDDRWELELRVWPGNARLAAFIDFHGNWLEWLL
jgi:hypothetical protein